MTAGYREVVISGINLGRWGRDLAVSRQPSAVRPTAQGPTTNGQRPVFEDLVTTILSDTALEKLRISSVEPMDWSDELIRMMAESPRIAKHAHVPLQSGSDAVLRRMHRKYRPWHYREKIEKIHAAMPTAAIGADVMVGFPGESEAEFEETRRLGGRSSLHLPARLYLLRAARNAGGHRWANRFPYTWLANATASCAISSQKRNWPS